VEVIGGWRLTDPLGEPQETRLAVRRLIAFLVVRGRVQQRALVAGTLWPDSSDRRASANLRSTLWHSRLECPGIADGDTSTVWLCDGVHADFDEATEVLRAVLVGDAVQADRLGVLHGDVLPDWPDEWVVPVRFLHRQLRLLALERSTRDACVTTHPQRC
jgi:hypothetical protein